MTVPSQCIYGVYGVWALSLVDFMSDVLPGNCIAPSRINFDGDETDDYQSLDCEPWTLKGLANKGNASFQSIDANMQSVAMAVTSEMRKQGTDWDYAFDPREILAKGTVFRTTVCTQFDWKWLAFPLALILLTTLLLCIMCAKMRFDRQRVPAWKSSLLPLLFVGNQVGPTVDAGPLKQIEKDTNQIVVSLSHNERGWEFVGEEVVEQKKKGS
ncbi:hypothetical protein N0V86_001436 [Didymella sp. IMI 355093]|nr:hypothetical protein N0V86_001436 [Didymella sp. IMI 355093]